MNNETINSRNKKKHNTSNNKLKIISASAVLAGALFAAPSLVSADSWQANTPRQIADNITNTSTPYKVKSGDSLWGISEALKTKGLSVTPDALALQNHIADPNWIYTGNSLTFTGQTNDSSQPTNSNPAPSSSQQIDKSTLETKLQEANKYIYTQGVYTESSLDNLRQAAMRGNGVIKSDAATQQDVTNAVNNIDQAINGLVKVSSQQVNKRPLQAKLQEANKYIYTQGVYTESSLDNLRQAAMRGNGVIKSDAATQQDVTNAVNNIDQAINGLVKQ